MGIIIILFLIAMTMAFMMLSFRAWEIKTLRENPAVSPRKLLPEVYFRHIEKIMLYLAKHIIQSIVLMVVKYWFIVVTKTKKWIKKNWPKISKFLKKEAKDINQQKNSFVRRAILESKTKIRRIKEKVRREHE
jgi:hypothetical protein